MRLSKINAPAALLMLSALSYGTSALADVWVFEPSISLDQRFDDNFYLNPAAPGSLSATRAVGDLGLSRKGSAYSITGLARLDTLLVSNTDVSEEGLDSNGILIFDASRRTARSRYNLLVNYTVDTPSRDIEADISDDGSVGENTSLLVAQSLLSNVARQNLSFEPRFEYDVSRRLEVNTALTYATVAHDLADPNDVIYNEYLERVKRDPERDPDEPLLAYGSDEVRDLVGVFAPVSELDDYRDTKLSLGLRYKLSPITTLSTTASYSRFESDVAADPATLVDEETQTGIVVPFELLTADGDDGNVRRYPRVKSVSSTTRLVVGLERLLTPTLQFTVGGGVYTNTTGFSDSLNANRVDLSSTSAERVGAIEQVLDTINEALNAPDTTTDGWLGSVGLTYDAGLTRFSGRFAVDVQPSSAGSQVETNQLIGVMQRTLSPRLDFSFYASAFEPDRLKAQTDNKFSRRYISFQPRIEWKYSRAWTLTAAYRYRRQKSRIDPISAESNALLFAIQYSPPSKIGDAAAANGL